MKESISVLSTYQLNQDSLLNKLLLHSNKTLWTANVYLNRGTTDQIKCLLSRILEIIPVPEQSRVIIGGDWNVNLLQPSPSREILIKLAQQFKLKIISGGPTSKKGNIIDFYLLGASIEGQAEVQNFTLSDHKPVKSTFKLPFPKKSPKIILPNRKLANKLTTKNIQSSRDPVSFLTQNAKLSQSFPSESTYNLQASQMGGPTCECHP